jgi:hypothetical protein
MIHQLKFLCLALLVVVISSCELDLLENPNRVATSNADVNFILNRIELDYAVHFNQFSDPGMRLTRMLNQGAAIYDNAVGPGDSEGRWSTAYASILTDVATLLPIAENAQLFVHAGIARTIRASVLMNLVDAFGNVPYSEATDPTNFNPKTDDAASVYAAALADLDAAAANFAAVSKATPTNDLYFNAKADSWIRVVNTLKLKYYLNRKLIDKAGSTSGINGLIAGNQLVSAADQNFILKFGANLTNPDTRHPRYAGQYGPTGGGDYQSNSYMGYMYSSKGFPDPRIRYYFYRQTIKNPTDVNALRCITNAKPGHYKDSDVYCLPTSLGYWGRDHLSNEGIPPDGLLRTAWGLYPAGGLYDNDAGRGVSLGAGAGGAGIHPILTRSFVDFMLAESALTLGTTGDARALLKSAVEKSLADVRSMVLGTTEASKINTYEASISFVWATEAEKYVNKVLELYDAATTDDGRLNIIATEYWLALHGNGIESYNLYRRTGKPAGQQPALEPTPGAFVRSYYYPLGFVARNKNATQKPNATVQVFWDTNPANFIN